MIKRNLWLLLIVGLAFMVRVYHLGSLPGGFHNDEVMNGYVGRFTLQNGVDLYGNRLPFLYFDNFGDYPNILPMYLSGIFTYLFGVNPLAVRLPVALAGTMTVILIYLFTREIFPKTKIPLISALVLAVSPWHIVLSRATAEGVTAGMVYILGLWLSLYAVRKSRYVFLILAYLAWGLTYWLYPSYRMMVPLTVLPIGLLIPTRDWRLRRLTWLIALLFLGLTLIISQTIWGKGRYNQTSVFTFNDVIPIRLTQAIYGDKEVSLLITRIFHNKLWAGGREIVHQYLTYWSGTFLLTRGGLPARYQLTDQGLFPITLALFLVLLTIGLILKRPFYRLSSKWNRKGSLFWWYLLLLSPIPAALTLEDAPNVHRALLMGILICVFWGVVIDAVWRNLDGVFMWLKVVLVTGLVFESLYFWHQYAVHAPITQATFRNTDVDELIREVIRFKPDYGKIVMPAQSQAALRYLFATQQFDKNLAGQFTDHIYINHIGNIYFDSNACPSQSLQPDLDSRPKLIIDRAECPINETLTLIKTIKVAEVYDAYRIYSQ